MIRLLQQRVAEPALPAVLPGLSRSSRGAAATGTRAASCRSARSSRARSRRAGRTASRRRCASEQPARARGPGCGACSASAHLRASLRCVGGPRAASARAPLISDRQDQRERRAVTEAAEVERLLVDLRRQRLGGADRAAPGQRQHLVEHPQADDQREVALTVTAGASSGRTTLRSRSQPDAPSTSVAS